MGLILEFVGLVDSTALVRVLVWLYVLYMLMVRTRRSEVVIERMDRCLRVVSFISSCLCLGWVVWFFWLMCLVSRVGWLVCVRRLLPLIPPPRGWCWG